MMNAVQNIGYYMMIEVVEPKWHAFLEKMKTVENVDEVLEVHQNFLDSCLKNCMLTDANLLRNSSKLFKVCVKFCDFIQVSLFKIIKWKDGYSWKKWFWILTIDLFLTPFLLCIPIVDTSGGD